VGERSGMGPEEALPMIGVKQEILVKMHIFFSSVPYLFARQYIFPKLYIFFALFMIIFNSTERPDISGVH
jgi:hypothetical protein